MQVVQIDPGSNPGPGEWRRAGTRPLALTRVRHPGRTRCAGRGGQLEMPPFVVKVDGPTKPTYPLD